MLIGILGERKGTVCQSRDSDWNFKVTPVTQGHQSTGLFWTTEEILMRAALNRVLNRKPAPTNNTTETQSAGQSEQSQNAVSIREAPPMERMGVTTPLNPPSSTNNLSVQQPVAASAREQMATEAPNASEATSSPGNTSAPPIDFALLFQMSQAFAHMQASAAAAAHTVPPPAAAVSDFRWTMGPSGFTILPSQLDWSPPPAEIDSKDPNGGG